MHRCSSMVHLGRTHWHLRNVNVMIYDLPTKMSTQHHTITRLECSNSYMYTTTDIWTGQPSGHMCSLHMHFYIVIHSFVLAVKININHIHSPELFA
ncbi:hypothetical protein L208DRAFT_279628 [Tricholoma matsutake]|nr:hypothetical protein L208DRAFT_279628 [Tricholoma matsutake 945]